MIVILFLFGHFHHQHQRRYGTGQGKQIRPRDMGKSTHNQRKLARSQRVQVSMGHIPELDRRDKHFDLDICKLNQPGRKWGAWAHVPRISLISFYSPFLESWPASIYVTDEEHGSSVRRFTNDILRILSRP